MDINKKKWIDSGLLEGIDENHHLNLIRIFNTAVDLIEDKKTDDTLSMLLFPVIRRIYGLVVSDKHRFYKFIEDDDLDNKIFKMINVGDIITKLIIVIEKIIPYISSHYKFIDAQAEVTTLFCQNYVGFILNNYYDMN